MTKRILTGALLLMPFAASADTLVMKDGTRFRGNFESADSRRMMFTEENGNRREISIFDVQELRFGNEGQQYAPPNSQPPFSRADVGPGLNPGPLADSIDQLRQDLRIAMDNTRISPDQRGILEDARARLQAELERSRNGRPVDQGLLRTALDNIRGVIEGMQRDDRDRLNGDIRRISSFMRGQQGRDY